MMSPHHYRVFVGLFFAFAVQCGATSIAIVITHDNIVIASDSKQSGLLPNSPKTTNKIVVLNERTIVTMSGLSITGEGWNVMMFLDRVKEALPVNASVSIVDGIIVDKLKPFMEDFAAHVTYGGRQDQLTFPTYLMAFIIAGYEKGVPVIDIVQINIDWNSRKISNPTIVPEYPSPQSPVNAGFSMWAFGENDAFTAACNKPSSAERKAAGAFPGFAQALAMPIAATMTLTLIKLWMLSPTLSDSRRNSARKT